MKALVARDVAVPLPPSVRVHLLRCDLIWLPIEIVRPVSVAAVTALRSPERTLRHEILLIAPVMPVHVCLDRGLYCKPSSSSYRYLYSICILDQRKYPLRIFSTLAIIVHIHGAAWRIHLHPHVLILRLGFCIMIRYRCTVDHRENRPY